MSELADNPHLHHPVQVFGPRRSPQRVVIALHGRRHDPSRIRKDVVERIEAEGFVFVVPEAYAHQWYPGSFLEPLAQNQPRLTQAFGCIDELVSAWEQRGVPRRHQILLGFSQGACLACEYLHRQMGQEPFGALVAFSGGLMGPRGTTWSEPPGSWPNLPVILGGSTQDPWVPHWRMIETEDVFTRGGADVRTYYREGSEHDVYPEQIAMTSALFRELSVPAEPAPR